MNTIKTVLLAALLSAAAYGVYVGVTGAPPNFGPRRRARDWEENTEVTDAGIPSAPLVNMGEDPALASVAPTPLAAAAVAANVAPAAPASAAADGSPLGPIASAPPVDAAPERYSSDQGYPSTATHPDAGHSGLLSADDPLSAAVQGPAENLPGGEAPAGYESQGTQPANSHADFEALMQSVRGLLEQNRLADAHLELSEWYGDPHFTPEEDAQVTNLLDQLAGTVIYSREHLLERPYDVQPGDTLEKVADAYEVPWELLANINGLRDPRAVRPGNQLKVVKGPFDAYVNLSKFQLVLYLGNRYAGRFQIGIGKDQETPEGKFVVLQKLVNPTYYGKPVVDKDDPQNPLGEFAIDLGNSIWIHGTNEPQTIGRADSRGCIRLANRDIRDVFEILTAKSERSSGSVVQIKR